VSTYLVADDMFGAPAHSARRALVLGLDRLREQLTQIWPMSIDDEVTLVNVVRGHGLAGTCHRNEVPTRHVPDSRGRPGPRNGPPRSAPPLGRPGDAGGAPAAGPRTSTGPRPTDPRPAGGPNGSGSRGFGQQTVELPVPELDTVPRAGVGTAGPPSHPDRPDPSDAAAEVFALVERAQQGDAEAFGLIYDRYFDTVFRFIYFRVGNRPLAEDLTSDTFLRALKRIGSFTWQGRDLGAWLVTIARNLVADHFKSGRYRLEVTTGDVLDADQAERGPEGSPELAVIDHITNVDLLSAVKKLNHEQQECIVLRFLQGFSVAETAQTMGKNEGAIKALQYRAVRTLNRLLSDGFKA
jgi:RNA polymerase sigma-70 factor, ECF subfamily